MSALDAENSANDDNYGDNSDGVVTAVCDYLAGLPAKDGLDACIAEGRRIASIVEPLGLPQHILAAVYA